MATEKLPRGFEDLLWNSPLIRREWEEGRYEVRTHYVPTDFAKTSPAEQRELLGGYNPSRDGVCPVCFTVRAANGMCPCNT